MKKAHISSSRVKNTLTAAHRLDGVPYDVEQKKQKQDKELYSHELSLDNEAQNSTKPGT